MRVIIVILLFCSSATELTAQQFQGVQPLQPPAVAEPLKAETAFRSIDWELFEQRLMLDSESGRLFVAYAVAGAGVEYLSGGVRTPQLTAGTVELHGLLRELNRPTRFNPASDVYRQSPGLALNSAMEPTRRYGVQLQPWHAVPAIFGVVRDEAPETLGMHWNFGRSALLLRGLLLTTDADADTVDEGWYTEYPRFTGGRINHLAGELVLQADRTRLAAAAAGSGGPLTVPASSARLHACYQVSFVRSNALWVLTQPGYVTPEGRFWRDRQQRALDLRVGRARGPFGELDVSQRLTRAPLRSDRNAPSRVHYAVVAGVNEAALPGLLLTAAGGAARTSTVDDRNRHTETVIAEARLGIRAGSTAVRLKSERQWHERQRDRDRIELSAVRNGTLTVEARLIATTDRQQTLYAGRAEARLRAGRMLLYARVATLNESTVDEVAEWYSVPLTLTVGGAWRFTVPVPQRIYGHVDPATTPRPGAPRVPE